MWLTVVPASVQTHLRKPQLHNAPVSLRPADMQHSDSRAMIFH